MARLTHCVCGATAAQTFSRGGLDILVCKCGVGRLYGEVDMQQLDADYRSGQYHRAADRHQDCVPYADRYTHDLYIATVRWQRYGEVLGGRRMRAIRTTLDVGSANGAFCDYLASMGLKAWGIEPAPDFARTNVITGTLADLFDATGTPIGFHSALGLGRVDLITFHDVLEHCVDPQAELGRAAALLKGGGVLIIDVPFVWGADGAGEKHFKAEHLWHFCNEALVKMVNQAGLAAIASYHPIPGKLVLCAEKP